MEVNMGGCQHFVIIALIGQGAEQQLVYMVGQIFGLLFTGFVLFFTWSWLFLNRHRERGIGGKIGYGLVMAFWLISTTATAFFAYNNSPAFGIPIVIVIILCFVKSKQYRKLGNETTK